MIVDGLPEHQDFRDDGCSYHPSCLRCPFPRCRYDYDGVQGSLKSEMRAREAAEMRDAGMSTQAIADKLGISRKQVYKYLRKARDAG